MIERLGWELLEDHRTIIPFMLAFQISMFEHICIPRDNNIATIGESIHN